MSAGKVDKELSSMGPVFVGRPRAILYRNQNANECNNQPVKHVVLGQDVAFCQILS